MTSLLFLCRIALHGGRIGTSRVLLRESLCYASVDVSRESCFEVFAILWGNPREVSNVVGSGIFQNCPAGNLSSITPNNATVGRIQLPVPSGSYQLNIDGKGYYVVKIYVVKADGSTTYIPRYVIVDCYKTQ